MKRTFYILTICLCSSLFLSCSKDDDKIDYEWKNANEAAFNELESKTGYEKAEIPGGPGHVYYKVLKESSVTDPDSVPKYTSVVTVAYKGWLYNGAVFDKGPKLRFKIDGTVFYINGKEQPATSVISGWKIALQNMREGDKWEVWIPWQLGYGSSGSGSGIPGYSTLVFEIELTKIDQLEPLGK